MSDPEKDAFRRKLDDLADRLGARIDELRKRGAFSDIHEALLHRICEKNEDLKNKVAKAEGNGTIRELMKAEFERDFSSLSDDFLQFEERLDAESMKHRG